MVLAWSLRTRWRSLLLLATLIAITGGASLAAWAGARRTSSAFGRMIAATNSFDYAVASGSLTDRVDLAPGALAHLPGWCRNGPRRPPQAPRSRRQRPC
jgi:hypothetical protein